MSQKNDQRLEWLQVQAQRFHKPDLVGKTFSLSLTPRESKLLEMINVQTGILLNLNEEISALRSQYEKDQKELRDFMAREGFNYPSNAWKSD